MRDGKATFNVLESIKGHMESLKPLQPKQAVVCIGEYPIKILLKDPVGKTAETVPIFVGKSSDEIYKWLPKGFKPHYVLGFEDADVNTHFWYNAQPYIAQDESVLASLKKKPIERLRGVVSVASVWDGVGAASLPALASKLRAANMNALSMAVLPAKVQPSDAYFNSLAALGACTSTEGSMTLLLERDCLENFEAVDRDGAPMKGNVVVNYLVNLLLSKETLVEEVIELSRSFNIKMFTVLLSAGASLKIYGSLENMLDAALLKPLFDFDVSTSGLLYVLVRMPENLRDKLPRAKIELAVADWFKDKTALKSLFIAEPIYTEDTSDRVDLALIVGGFDLSKMLGDYEKKVKTLKAKAVEKGVLKEEEWQAMMCNLLGGA